MSLNSVWPLGLNEQRILRWLECYPFQRADDVLTALAAFEGRSVLYEHLARLEEWGLIETLHLGITRKRLYHLSPSGQAVCADWTGERAPQLPAGVAEMRVRLIRLLPRLPVLLTVQDLVNGLVTGAATALTRQGRQARLVQWHWQRDYTHAFVPQGRRQQALRIHADGILTLRLDFSPAFPQAAEWVQVMILYNLFDEIHLMRQRIENLVRWRESAERWPVYSQMPLALILATTPRQAEWWHLLAERVHTRSHTDLLQGAIATLSPKHPAGHGWRLPWRRLGSDTSCHLQELLLPTSVAAFPNLRMFQFSEPDFSRRLAQQEAHPVLPAVVFPSSYRLKDADARNSADGESLAFCLASTPLRQRHWEILLLCFAHPLLARIDLEGLLGMKPKPLQALLGELEQMEYLHACVTSVGVRWHLAESGLRLLACMGICRERRLVRSVETGQPLQQRGVAGLLHQVQHTAGVYGFLATVARALAPLPDTSLLWWETGGRCERTFVWRDQWYRFKPDAQAAVRQGKHTWRFWLEWDRGTMGVRDLESKCATYAAYLTSREWTDHVLLPPILVCVVKDVSQEQRFVKTAQALLAHLSSLKLYLTTAGLLATQGVLAPIWRPVLPQQPRAPPIPRLSLFSAGTEDLSS